MNGRFTGLGKILLCAIILSFGIKGSATDLPVEGPLKYKVSFGESYHNYLPGGSLRIRVQFKNITPDTLKISEELTVLDSAGIKAWDTLINLELLPDSGTTIPLIVPIPQHTGFYTLTAAGSGDKHNGSRPSFPIQVVSPGKSTRLKKILVHTPDEEQAINAFLKSWDIKAPTISWGQVLLLGKKSRDLYAAGDRQIMQLIERALNREMSVIFLDFGPATPANTGNPPEIILPYNVKVNFIQSAAPERRFVLIADNKELTYGFKTPEVENWNGSYGITVPATDLRFDGKGVKINALVTTGNNPTRFPVVELVPESGKGKVYLCQLLTDGRFDESAVTPRNKPTLPAYDPLAVQFLLNLISATVGDNLMK